VGKERKKGIQEKEIKTLWKREKERMTRIRKIQIEREGKDIMKEREREEDRETRRGMEGDREIKYIEIERKGEQNTYI
jgi:hypothetical protein